MPDTWGLLPSGVICATKVKIITIKTALINSFILTMAQITTCNVACNVGYAPQSMFCDANEPIRSFHPSLPTCHLTPFLVMPPSIPPSPSSFIFSSQFLPACSLPLSFQSIFLSDFQPCTM